MQNFPTDAFLNLKKMQIDNANRPDPNIEGMGQVLGSVANNAIKGQQDIRKQRAELIGNFIKSNMFFDESTKEQLPADQIMGLHDQFIATGKIPENIRVKPISYETKTALNDRPSAFITQTPDGKMSIVDASGNPIKDTSGYNVVKVPSKASSDIQLPDEDVKTWSEAVAKTGQLPTGIGMGGIGLKKQLLSGGAKIMREKGVNPADQQQSYRAESQAMASSSGINARVQDAKVNQALDLRKMVDNMKDAKTGEYKIPPSLHAELALGLARLLSPTGQVGIQLEQELKQATGREAIAKTLIYFGADPRTVGGSTQDVIKMFIDSVDRQGEMAEKLRDTYTNGKVGSSFINYIGQTPQNVQNIGAGIPINVQTLPQGVTEDDIQHTMKKYNVSREEVLKRIGAK